MEDTYIRQHLKELHLYKMQRNGDNCNPDTEMPRQKDAKNSKKVRAVGIRLKKKACQREKNDTYNGLKYR
jgi:hypothetical protein